MELFGIQTLISHAGALLPLTMNSCHSALSLSLLVFLASLHWPFFNP